MTLEPDAENDQPYEVHVAYVGEFQLGPELAVADMEHVARVNAAAILLPYVRQTISDLTSRGTSGPILVQPFNVAAMLDTQPDEND